MIRATIIVAQSIDGCITRHDEPGTAFSSQEDQAFFHEALQNFDSMVMGRETFENSKKAILNAPSPRWLRKILTHSPEKWEHLTQTDVLEFTDLPIDDVLSELQSRERRNCAILGGESVYEMALQSKLVGELWVTIEARVFGTGKRLARMPIDACFSLQSAQSLGSQTALLKFTR